VADSNNGNWKRELAIAALATLMTAFVCFAGWALNDRLHWASVEKQIEVNTRRLDVVESRLDKEVVSESEHQQLLQTIQGHYADEMDAMQRLNERIDRLVVGVTGLRKMVDPPADPPKQK
jgi:preprotein translocase subunit SecA